MPWSSTFRYHHGTTVFRVPPCSGVALFPPHTRERLTTSNGSRGTNASPFLLFVPSICFVCGCSVNCGSATRRFIEQRGQLFFPFSFGLDNELTGVSSTQKSLRHCEKDGASTFVRCCYVQPEFHFCVHRSHNCLRGAPVESAVQSRDCPNSFVCASISKKKKKKNRIYV